jgi:transposase
LCLDLSYQEMMRSQDPQFALRYQIVLSALSKGIRPTMRAFRCSRNTVRLWLRRYQEQGLAGLQERSRAPHHIPHKAPPEVEQQVLEACQTLEEMVQALREFCQRYNNHWLLKRLKFQSLFRHFSG